MGLPFYTGDLRFWSLGLPREALRAPTALPGVAIFKAWKRLARDYVGNLPLMKKLSEMGNFLLFYVHKTLILVFDFAFAEKRCF